MLYYTILYYTILCYTMLYYTILYYNALFAPPRSPPAASPTPAAGLPCSSSRSAAPCSRWRRRVYIYIYIYMHMYMCICMYMCIYIYIYIHTHMWGSANLIEGLGTVSEGWQDKRQRTWHMNDHWHDVVRRRASDKISLQLTRPVVKHQQFLGPRHHATFRLVSVLAVSLLLRYGTL